MATFSRNDSISSSVKTSQTASILPSMDISSILVKTLENSIDDEKSEDEKLTKTISDAINMSDLVKGKETNDENTNELNKLLKEKNKTNDNSKSDELSNLLTNKKSENKSSKKPSSVKSNSDKAANAITSTVGKVLTGGFIGTTVASIIGAKGLKDGASKVVTGTGKVAGGLVSKIGDIGGGAISLVGKLFGPVGNIIGKAVGTAVATPFKVVGGAITGAIGALGKIISTPLKEIVVKGGIIVAVVSQLFVFLEGLIAKFTAEKDMKSIQFMAKIESGAKMIPDRIQLALEQILSKVRIFGNPIYGSGLSEEEKEEKEDLEKTFEKNKKGSTDAAKFLARNTKGFADLAKEARLNFEDYDIDTEEGQQALKADALASLKKQGYDQNKLNQTEQDIDRSIERRAYIHEHYDKRLTEKDKNNLARYRELLNADAVVKDSKYFEYKKAELNDKKDQYEQEALIKGISKQMEQGDYTEYEAEYTKKHMGESVFNQAMAQYSTNHEGAEYQFASATSAEKFLQNEYKNWKDAWSKLFKDLKQDIGIQVTQKVEEPNSINSRSRR